ncbi:hypothetical protein D3C78_1971970 [compost metagenome]
MQPKKLLLQRLNIIANARVVEEIAQAFNIQRFFPHVGANHTLIFLQHLHHGAA